MPSRTVRPVLWTAVLLVLAASCAPLGTDAPDACAADAACAEPRADAAVADTHLAPDVVALTGPQPTDLLAIELVPASPTLTAVDGAHPMQQFTVTGHQRDGHTRAVTGGIQFVLADTTLGTLDGVSGAFDSAGVGGVSTVQAFTLDGSRLSATTTLTVDASAVVLGPGVTAADVDTLEHATASPTAALGPTIAYPLDGAVMPLNVFPPRVMWTVHHASPTAADLFRVALVRPHATLRGYFANAPSLRDAWPIAQDAWSTLARSDVGQPIETRVAVLSHGTLYAGAPRAFRTVDAVIAGAVYYWSPTHARLRRIDVEPATLVDFLPNPGAGCIGCHTVSRDGRRLEGFLEQPVAGDPAESVAAFDLTRDLTAAPAPRLFRAAYPNRRCSSFNNATTRLVAGGCGAEGPSPLSLIDTATGFQMTGVGSALGLGMDPEWSPDDRTIAYTNATDDLVLARVGAGDAYAAPTTLHAAASTPGGTMDWHPSWTPDSAWLAFQHGNTRRTAVAVHGTVGAVAGSLYIISHAGGAPVRLANLDGPATENDAYRPVFSPFDSGGYFWLLFTSTRAYGNATSGVAAGSQQVWVAAIHNRPDGTTDPSSVPYYLAGQEAGVPALSPYWAPPPCRPNGNACSTGGDCCSGTCDPDSTGENACHSGGSACHVRGAICDGSADCCHGLVCTSAHLCDQPPPG